MVRPSTASTKYTLEAVEGLSMAEGRIPTGIPSPLHSPMRCHLGHPCRLWRALPPVMDRTLPDNQGHPFSNPWLCMRLSGHREVDVPGPVTSNAHVHSRWLMSQVCKLCCVQCAQKRMCMLVTSSPSLSHPSTD